MPKYIKKKDLKNAIDECTWYHIGKGGELVEGANSSEHEPLYKYSDIKKIIKGLPTRKFEDESQTCDTCKLKGTTKWCDNQVVCRAYQPKIEPNSSEKPNNFDKDINVRSKDEPQTEDLQDWKDRMWAEAVIEPQTKCYLRTSCDHYGDKQVCGRCREYNLYSHTKDEPQTDCAWK